MNPVTGQANQGGGGLFRIALRGLRYHSGAHAATALGIAVAAMVLSGALLVGDALRAGLKERALGRLGWVDAALSTVKPFGQDLANALLPDARATPALALAANLQWADGNGPGQSVGHVTVMGVQDGFFGGEVPTGWPEEGIWLGSDLGDQAARLKPGDKVTLRVAKPGGGPPRESLLGQQAAEQAVLEWDLPVRGRIGESMDRFSPRSSLAPSRLVVVPLERLQSRLNLPGRANTLLARGNAGDLNRQLTPYLRPEDFGLAMRGPSERARDQVAQARATRNPLPRALPRSIASQALAGGEGDDEKKLAAWYGANRPYLLVESSGLYLSQQEEGAVLHAAVGMGLETARVLVHLANRVESANRKVPYSVVAAVDGPNTLLPETPALGADGIALVGYKGAPWEGLKVSDPVRLNYFPVEDTTPPREAPPVTFRFAGMVRQEGLANDADLSPAFPGITDKLDMASWQAPFPIDLKAISQTDETYWRDHRGAPKAYISLEKGKELWGGRFGVLTSIRLRDPKGRPVDQWLGEFRRSVRTLLNPETAGLIFRPAREQAILASAGSSDFGGLFLGFSSFLLVSGLLLAWLLMGLGLERRRREFGVLAATGWRPGIIRRLLLWELGLVGLAGAIVGALAGAWLAPRMISILLAAWPDPELARTLRPVVNPFSLLMGAVTAWLAGLAAAWFSARKLARETPLALLQGDGATESGAGWGGGITIPWVSVGLLLVGVTLLSVSPWLPPGEPQAGGFFTAGLAILSGGLGVARNILIRARKWPVQTPDGGSLARMAVRNASRNTGRSMLTLGLLAFASFLLVAVEVFRRQPPGADKDEANPKSPLGGCSLWVELDLPLFEKPDEPAGRQGWLDAIERRFGTDPTRARAERTKAEALLAKCAFFPFRLSGEDDAGCLNLYRPGQPRVLGAPEKLVREGGFQFATSLAPKNPWSLLEDEALPVPAVVGEASAVQWILKGSLGSEVALGEGRKALISGLMHDSPFQSELVMGDAAFRKLFPDQDGWRILLVRCPEDQKRAVAETLRLALAGQGAEVVETRVRVARALGVENTYLTVFQALGGLGLILGTVGLGVVLLRGVWERRKELALLGAIGYRPGDVGRLLLIETLVLLLGGLGLGVTSALVAVAPYATNLAGNWLGLLMQVLACLVTGLVAGAFACRAAMKVPLLAGLRSE